MKKFTFKTERPTGRYRSFFPTSITIKLTGKDVGTIYETGKIGFHIKKKDLTPYRDWETDRKSTRLNSSHSRASRMPSSA